MLEVLPEGLDCASDGRARGRTSPTDTLANALRKDLKLPATRKVCELVQDPASNTVDECQAGDGGWCYVDGEEGSRCRQQVVFNDSVLAAARGSRVYLQCISEYSPATSDAGQ